MKFSPDDETEIEYAFTIEYGDDENTIILRCESSAEITPTEYFELLKEYIGHMETLTEMNSSGMLN